MAVAIKAPKPAKTVTILDRQDFGNNHILYTVLSSNGVDKHWTTIVDGAAKGCTCRELPDGRISKYACYHMAACEKNEQERSTDQQQHVHDDLRVYSCLSCGKPMTADVFCYKCNN